MAYMKNVYEVLINISLYSFVFFPIFFLQTLVDAMLDYGVDLIVLEGMGRAVHTNLYAKFSCECLKVAVLKNRWLAQRLGGEMFAVIFKYENAQ